MINETSNEIDYLPKNESLEIRNIVQSNSVDIAIMEEPCLRDRNNECVSDVDNVINLQNENSDADCARCHGNCNKTGICNGLKRDKNGTVTFKTEETTPCCAKEKKKSFLFRKSTNLLISGVCMLGVTLLSIADVATDVLTALEYYQSRRYTAFALSLVFLIIPPILLTAGIIRRRDDSKRNTTTSSTPCYVKFLIFIFNVPLKLYMVWLQLVYSYRCFKRFWNWRKSGCLSQEATLMEGSLSHFINELTLYKLWNSVFESMPQLLLTIHVIMTSSSILNSNEGYLLIASSAFSFSSLCVGIIFYQIKSKEAECQPVNSKRRHQPLRSKSTRLGLMQIFLISIYTVCYLGSRALSFSYFIVFFEWFAAIVPALHWLVVFLFFTYRRYTNQRNTMHHYRMTTYHRQSSSFVYVLVHSIVSVFIHIKPECEEVLDQPMYYKIVYYFFYTAENCVMILMPLILRGLPGLLTEVGKALFNIPSAAENTWDHIALLNASTSFTDDDLIKYQYFPALYSVLGALALGGFTCSVYHILVHKSARFTREQVFGPCCKCCFGYGGFLCFSCSCCCCCRNRRDDEIFVSCKNTQTHEICKVSLKDIKKWKQSTESKLLNKKPLRQWKVLQNSIKASIRPKKTEAREDVSYRSESSVEIEQDPYCPYTMRRSGLHILSDPKGNLFYAPIAEIKSKTLIIS